MKISRQLKWQLDRISRGLCRQCADGKIENYKGLCNSCALKMREYHRKPGQKKYVPGGLGRPPIVQ